MASKRAWKTYPSTYRQQEIKMLTRWIQSGESGSIVGLAGAGKSNLLGLLSRKPETVTGPLKASIPKLALIFVDFNNLPDMSLNTFYRIILRSLYEARTQLTGIEKILPLTVESLYRKVEDKKDPFLSQSALREALLLFQENDVRLVLVLDPFDQFCRTADTQVLDNLRGLRDSFKTTLSYIVGLRSELTGIRSPLELGELLEILDVNTCWVGKMEREDARWVISQVEEGMGRTFTDDQADTLIRLTGSYPALLKAAGLWASGVLSDLQPEAWSEALLREPGIQNRLKELWQGLAGEEQFALAELQNLSPAKTEKAEKARENFNTKHKDALIRLKRKRLCEKKSENGHWQVFSPLFGAYIKTVGRGSAGKIWRHKREDIIFKGTTNLEDKLQPQDRKLLLYFLENPYKILSKDDIIFALWPDEALVANVHLGSDTRLKADDREILSLLLKRPRLDRYDIIFSLWPEKEIFPKSVVTNDGRLQKAIAQLRHAIEDEAGAPGYIQTVPRIGYRFYPEGATK